MRVLRLVVCVLVAFTGLAATASAQVMLDLSKITCEQFVLFKLKDADPDQVVMWLSGYYNAKRNNTVIDVEGLKVDAGKVRDYCRMNSATTVMQAVEKVLGPIK
jgi:acid stress chaperone HdeB